MIKQASEDCFTFLGKLLDINVGHEWLPVALNGGFFWCKRDCLLCGGCAVICWVSSPRWHYKCINCTATRIRHPTCHKMCSLKGFRSLKVSTLLIWRVSDSYWSGWIWELPGTSRPWPWRLRWPLTQQSCILGIVGKLILMYFSTSFTFSLFWQFLAACWLVW